MFCPKCGTQNPDSGKFCRSCGTDLENVSAALSGEKPNKHNDFGMSAFEWEPKKSARERNRRKDPTEVFGDAIKQTLSGIGFLIFAIVLFTTGAWGGQNWWWAMLFPAFTLLSKGISDYLKSKKMEKNQQVQFTAQNQNHLNQSQIRADLPPQQTNYVAPDSRYKTGDLAPPSVTDNTTRHLEMDSEGQTMTLPKK